MGERMELKHVDMSFTAAGKEILSVSGITFDNTPFPYLYEDIEKVVILIDDDFEETKVVGLNIYLLIEDETKLFRFNIFDNDLTTLLNTIDSSVKPLVIGFDPYFQLMSVKFIPKGIYGMYKDNVNKPVRTIYDELGTLKSLTYLDVDPNQSDMNYYNASCHTTPKFIIYNEFMEIDEENSYFSIHRKNTTFIVSTYKEHIELISKITKKNAAFNLREHKVMVDDELLSSNDLILLRFYYSFDYYKLKFNFEYKSKEDIFDLNDNEISLISMLLFQ